MFHKKYKDNKCCVSNKLYCGGLLIYCGDSVEELKNWYDPRNKFLRHDHHVIFDDNRMRSCQALNDADNRAVVVPYKHVPKNNIEYFDKSVYTEVCTAESNEQYWGHLPHFTADYIARRARMFDDLGDES